MKHLQINPHEDSKYPITWVAKNVKTCLIDRNYKDNYEPVLGKAIFVRLPGSDAWHGYAANDEGWLSVCDGIGYHYATLPEIPIKVGIEVVEEDVKQWLKENVK